MMAEEWKMSCLDPQVSEDHRHTQKMRSAEGLGNERTESWHIKTFWNTSFCFKKQQHATVSVGDSP